MKIEYLQEAENVYWEAVQLETEGKGFDKKKANVWLKYVKIGSGVVAAYFVTFGNKWSKPNILNIWKWITFINTVVDIIRECEKEYEAN